MDEMIWKIDTLVAFLHFSFCLSLRFLLSLSLSFPVLQGQKHGCGAMFDFSPMMKLVKEEGKTAAEAWEATRDQILGAVRKGTWNRDKFVSDPIDDIESGKLGLNFVSTRKIDPKDLCDNALIQGVLEELDSVVQVTHNFATLILIRSKK